MSEKKMIAWIAMIWFLSFVHPIKRIFVYSHNDFRIKPGIGSVLIILTGIAYAKTYFALRQQNKSMVGKKATFSSTQSGNASSKSLSTDSEICEIESVQSQDKRAQSEDERAQSQYEHAQNQCERGQSVYQRAKNQDERAKSHHQRARNKYKRAQSMEERANARDQRDQSQSKRAENQDDFAHIQPDIQNKSGTIGTRNSSILQKHVLFHNPLSKSHKAAQPVNNAKEQRFLNTIIIIACIAVLTVLAGTIGAQFQEMILEKRPQMHRILKPILFMIYCLNFTVNPFIYCLRLKQYRKTFQIVYGCKC